MTLKAPNEKPRSVPLIDKLVNKNGDRFMVIDIGARGGVQPFWFPITEYTHFIGFEPDQVECDRLNTYAANARFYSAALHEHNGPQKFYLARSTKCHALLPINMSYWGRFPNSVYNTVVGETTVEAKSLDSVVAEDNIPKIDFIKIDVEGSELAILRGAKKSLSACGVLGIKTEVWWDPCLKNQPSFAELDIFLRGEGFFMFDLDLMRFNRNSLPAGHLQVLARQSIPGRLGVKKSISTEHGQVIGGDALYFRDPVYDHMNGITSFTWNAERLLTLVAFLDLLNYQDFAIEILEYFRGSLLAKIDVDELMDALVPPVGTTVIPYGPYWDFSRQIFEEKMYAPKEFSTLKKGGYVGSSGPHKNAPDQ